MRSVAWAVPTLLGRIPMDVAAKVGADRRAQVQLAVAVAGGCDRACTAAYDAALARLELVDAVELAGHQVFGEILDGRYVFLDVVHDRRGWLACRIVDRLP